MRRLRAPLLLLLTLFGCAASGQPFLSVQASLPKVSAGRARIYFYRTYAAFGVGMHARILIDGAMVGRSWPGGVFYSDVSDGRHEITVVGQNLAPDNKLSIRATEGEVQYVRTWIGGSGYVGRTNMEIVEPADGRQAVRELTYTGGETAPPSD